ncbi:putative Peptidoglycan glycosyltransferase [Ruminococcaceae bacterium BL-4]|nr:putative Peptidoglycan glycosyltransferase [Ruminococcaceae bacterium BL-4]
MRLWKKQLSRKKVCMGLLILVCGIFAVRLIEWQFVDGQELSALAEQSVSTTQTIPTARGEIVDMNGVGLATNKISYEIRFNLGEMSAASINKITGKLISLLKMRGESWNDTLPILYQNGEYEFQAGAEDAITYLKSDQFLKVGQDADPQTCIDALSKRYFAGSGNDASEYTLEQLRDILSVRYGMTMSGFSLGVPYVFSSKVSQETVAIISENSDDLPGVSTQITSVRQYPEPTLMPHILGNLGALSEKQYESLKSKGYTLNDTIGKFGIEAAMESTLRGSAGEKKIEYNSSGEVQQETVTKEPQAGNTVFLTIDSKVQKVAADSLAKNVQAAHATTKDCVGGGVVALRVSDFSVLAAASYPTYDLSQYSNASYFDSLLKDSSNPQVDRAFGSAFTPGSVFKPCVALAALQEGAITDTTKIVCNHVYDRFKPSLILTCMGWHGPMDVRSALAQSCNVFFCETGYRLGITSMDLYAKKLGLGVKTGVEIDETEGTLAGPESRTAAGGTWYDGDTVQAAIGQSDNQFSPAQLADYVATIANNGTRKKVHLVDHVTDYSRQNTISSTQGETLVDNSDYSYLSAENLKTVQEGMREVVTSGTARTLFSNYKIAIAAKTGTAETNGSDNVTFIAYAPYDNPQIAVAVVLPHGAAGTYAQNIAKDIFDAYFQS